MKKINVLFNRSEFIPISIVVLFIIPSVLPLLNQHFFHFSDEVHIANMYQMYKAIASGQIPPRWAPDMSYGFGYPLFNYYYVLPFYLGVFFYQIFQSFITSFKFLLLITTIGSGIFMYLFLRKFSEKTHSLVGSLIYIYSPYRAVDLYVRGAIGEVFAFMFFPLIGLLIYTLAKKDSWRTCGLLAIILSLFIVSHNLSPILIMPWFILVYFILKKHEIGLFKFIIALTLGVLCASYWLLPALIESVLLKDQPQFNFFDHFPFIRQLIYSKWNYGASLPGIGDDISFQIGIPNLLMIVLAIYYAIKNGLKKLNMLLNFTLMAIVVTLFMMNIRSTHIWYLLGIVNYIQFPWRLLLLMTFFTSFLVIFVRNKMLLIVLALLTLINIQYFKPNGYFDVGDDYFLKRYFANQATKGESEGVSGEYPAWLEDYAILPEWVDKRADFLPKNRLYSDNVKLFDYKKIGHVDYKTGITSRVGGELNSYLYYFPGWTGKLNGKVVVPEISKPYGTMTFKIPPGNWNFELKWEETVIRKVFDYISLISLLIAIALVFYPNKMGGNILKKK